MTLSISAKRRIQRKARLSRIREASIPKPRSLEEIQTMVQESTNEANKAKQATIHPSLLLSTALLMSEFPYEKTKP